MRESYEDAFSGVCHVRNSAPRCSGGTEAVENVPTEVMTGTALSNNRPRCVYARVPTAILL